jgi:hypothetical protein
MVMMFVGGIVSVLDGIPVLFLPYKTYGAGVFVSAQTLIMVKLLKLKLIVINSIY